jgi:hypothetical protein
MPPKINSLEPKFVLFKGGCSATHPFYLISLLIPVVVTTISGRKPNDCSQALVFRAQNEFGF